MNVRDWLERTPCDVHRTFGTCWVIEPIEHPDRPTFVHYSLREAIDAAMNAVAEVNGGQR